MADTTVEQAEGLLVAALVVGFALWYVLAVLQRRRPDFDIRLPIAVGIALRFIAVLAINTLPSASQANLRGSDESAFLGFGHVLAGTPFGTNWWPHGIYQLQTVVIALQQKLVPMSTATALRVTQIGISTLGIVLIVAAVYDLSGPRAARFASWLAALEPANIFFNGALHKEPLMVLATGLVIFGGTKLWRSLNPAGVLLVALGGVIGVETRSYAGWFLVLAAVLLTLASAIRKYDRPLSSVPAIYMICTAAIIMTPTLLHLTSPQSLRQLQVSQNANVGAAGTAGNNLALAPVNFSTRTEVIINLPQRMFDLLFRPFPWQLHDPSQQVGALGSLIALALFFSVGRYMWRARGNILNLTAPLLFPAIFLLVAYALSTGNAGTGFRYRTHLVLLSIGMVASLREGVRARDEEALSSITATRSETRGRLAAVV